MELLCNSLPFSLNLLYVHIAKFGRIFFYLQSETVIDLVKIICEW